MKTDSSFSRQYVYILTAILFALPISLCNAGVQALFFDDMESGIGNWTTQAPWALVTTASSSPTHSLHDSPAGNYGNNVDISVTLNSAISLADAVNPVLSFKTKYSTESCCDACYVEISANGGPWAVLGLYKGFADWNEKAFNLSSYTGQNIRIRFRIATDSSVTDDGWYIDDVLVTTDVGDMTVQPFSGFSSVGSAGGPFSPSSTIYTITNTGAVPLNWIAYAGAAWMDLAPAGSTIEPGQSTQLTCSINSAANTLSAGNYSGSITIDSQTGNQAIRQVYLTVNEAIDVQPAAGFSSAGKIGGPFSPSNASYTITNTGALPLNWTANANVGWLTVSPSSGTLAAGQQQTATVSINSSANLLPQGAHNGNVTFNDPVSGGNAIRPVSLSVGKRILVYIQYADTSPGGEYQNTLNAIRSVNSNFEVTELTNHTQLASALPGHDVFLIPEQENGGPLEPIGASWAATLNTFVSGGGVVVCCDFGNTYPILNGAGLMSIATSYSISDVSVTVAAPDDPIVAGVPATYMASNGSTRFSTTEQKVIVQSSGYPVVISKDVGSGKVILIGHDYFESNANQDKIVGNAVFNTVSDPLIVSPLEDFVSSGPQGGPFNITSKTYSLNNSGETAINWSANAIPGWLTISPGSGTLNAGDSINVEVSLNSNADILAPGTYNESGAISFANLISGIAKTRGASLTVLYVPGEIEIADSIEPVDDANMPFGDVIIGLNRTEHVTITNTDPRHSLSVNLSPPFEGFLEEFPSTTLDPLKWTVTYDSPTIDTVGISEPSAPYSIRLNSHDTIESKVWDLSELDAQVKVEYWFEHTGGGGPPDPGDDLIIEYWNGSTWVELERQYGSRMSMTNYEKRTILLPAAAMHAQFKLRIRANCSISSDDWFVDNVSLSLAEAGTLNETSLIGAGFRLANTPVWPIQIAPSSSVSFDVIFEPSLKKDCNSYFYIYSDDTDEPETRISLSGKGIYDYMEVTPDSNSSFAGHPGGPFIPTYVNYQLTNIGPVDIDWNAETDSIFSALPASGSLAPGASVNVKISPTSAANSLPKGVYMEMLRFVNLTTTLSHNRIAALNVYTDPKMKVSPASISISMQQGETRKANFAIENTGDGDLNFSISSRAGNFIPPNQPALIPDESEIERQIIAAVSQRDFNTPADVPFAKDRLIVRFKKKQDGNRLAFAEKQEVVNSIGAGKVLSSFKLSPDISVIELPADMNVVDALKIYNGKSEILYAEPDYEVSITSTTPNDSYFSSLWGMHNTGSSGGLADADIDAPEAWDVSTNGDKVIVAVIDSGIDYTHPDLAANIWINTAEQDGLPGVDDDGNGYVDDVRGYDFYNHDSNPMDDHGHGTHVSGTIGAIGNNGRGVVGVCWNAKIMALKFLSSGGSGNDSGAIGAIEYAVQKGAKIASNSWGGTSYSQALKDAIDAAGRAGLLFVASAGNDATNNDTYPHYPSSYNSPNILSVLSTDRLDRMSSFSCYGLNSVDLGAPGTDIYSCAPGNYYQSMSGTSMATPHVSGACALVWSAQPYYSYGIVKDIVMNSTDPLPLLSSKCVTGGRLNLYNAITAEGTGQILIEPFAGTIPSDNIQNITATFDGNCPPGIYDGEIVISANDPFYPEAIITFTMTVEPQNYVTEQFDANDPNQNDLAFKTFVFTPTGVGYWLCVREAQQLPVEPSGGNVLSLEDDDYTEVSIEQAAIPFYNQLYDTFYVGSNGYITFDSGDICLLETIEDHYALPRISALFDDLDPTAGGQISYKVLDDSVVVTYENIREYGASAGSTFQIQMLYNGKIIITFLDIAAVDGLAGLSAGNGVSEYFIMADLSESGACNFIGDVTGDESTDFSDFAIFAKCQQQQFENVYAKTVLDSFGVVSYGNNDGSEDWTGLWQEIGETDGPSKGIIRVSTSDYLIINPPLAGLDANYSVIRDVDLTEAINAQLTFDYKLQSRVGTAYVKISPDGGASWQTLGAYDQSTLEGLASIDISSLIGANVQIKFELVTGSKTYLRIDNVQVEYHECEPGPDCVECNFDRTGLIDFKDLSIFAEHWLE